MARLICIELIVNAIISDSDSGGKIFTLEHDSGPANFGNSALKETSRTSVEGRDVRRVISSKLTTSVAPNLTLFIYDVCNSRRFERFCNLIIIFVDRWRNDGDVVASFSTLWLLQYRIGKK